MKTILDESTRAEVVQRIAQLPADSTAQWGTMTLYQMLRHCTMWEEMAQGKISCKRVFIGRIFGKRALRSVLKDEQPLMRSSPSATELVVKGNGDIAAQKQHWIACIEAYAQYASPFLMHPFFGKMTKEQVGQLAYKHTDHHLRQFNG